MRPGVRAMITGALVIAGIAVIVVTLVLVVKEKRRTRGIQDHITKLDAQKQQYERKNMELKDRIVYLQSDRAYETEAKRMNYKNPDEEVAIVRRSRADEQTQESADNTVHTDTDDTAPQKKHYEIWYEYFFR